MSNDRQATGDEPGALATPSAEIGLCSACGHASVQSNARGSAFWRCTSADDDPTLLRYPPLPVRSCHAFTQGRPQRRDSSS